ncbi:hypothetical protein [Amycolatopsis methanolica]|uniref:hypothetical protein n=1 Tax=Amycolatopsis methanolica TaxID=1814 RepID=UPI00343E1BA9
MWSCSASRCWAPPPERFPALAHFARDVRPLGADRGAAFEAILSAHLAHIEAGIG